MNLLVRMGNCFNSIGNSNEDELLNELTTSIQKENVAKTILKR